MNQIFGGGFDEIAIFGVCALPTRWKLFENVANCESTLIDDILNVIFAIRRSINALQWKSKSKQLAILIHIFNWAWHNKWLIELKEKENKQLYQNQFKQWLQCAATGKFVLYNIHQHGMNEHMRLFVLQECLRCGYVIRNGNVLIGIEKLLKKCELSKLLWN